MFVQEALVLAYANGNDDIFSTHPLSGLFRGENEIQLDIEYCEELEFELWRGHSEKLLLERRSNVPIRENVTVAKGYAKPDQWRSKHF